MKIQKFFSSFDYIIFISAILLTIIGILFIYSANLSRSDLNREFIKQIIFASIGLIILITLLFIPTKSMSDFSLAFYIICIFGLIITLFFPYIKGQRRLNIFGVSFQFSEFMKIATIFLLSLYYSKKNKEEIRSILTYIIGLLIVLIPVGLILLQPDLGTMLVFIPIVLVISFMAGIKKRYIIYT
ncbi:MAG: FtsW/RodA/SpoVE family cell cycle protein, partial [Spirochaetes bacterium]|nr:FtsW/RodA/SpoVE family cell cycle protein [Spirochaetota bacterium]